jgi:hypothetical protein
VTQTYVASPNHIWTWGDGSDYMRATPEVREWLLSKVGKEMIYSSKWGWKGQWRMTIVDGRNHFAFADPKKAMMFKLVWGGA